MTSTHNRSNKRHASPLCECGHAKRMHHESAGTCMHWYERTSTFCGCEEYKSAKKQGARR